MLCDHTAFEKKNNCNEGKLIIKLEDKVNNVLRNFKKNGSISDSFYNDCFTSGLSLGFLYFLSKIHKDNCPVRSILSACNMHNSNLEKLWVASLILFGL